MNKIVICLLSLSLLAGKASAQFTITKGEDVLEIKGIFSGIYDYRILKSGQTNNKNNNFYIKDLQLDIKGRHGNDWEYEMQIDMNDLAINATGGAGLDPLSPGIKAAYIMYKALPVNIKFGYDKVPFSQGSLNDRYNNVYWSHGYLCDGNFFARRDLGLTLNKSFWKKRVNAYAGVYSGMGEMTLGNVDNDASGQPEFVGRVDVSYPSPTDYTDLDQASTPIPIFRIGANARYMDKKQPTGQVIPVSPTDSYGIRIVDGQNLKYGFDANFAYRNITVQLETDFNEIRPTSTAATVYQGTTSDVNHGLVKAGGSQVQVNYNWQSIHSIVSARYEHLNYNDLIYGHEEWLTVGYAYQLNGFKNCLKINYDTPLTEDKAQNPLKYTGRIKIGWQLTF
jgi:Phosphate-selective porin O and P